MRKELRFGFADRVRFPRWLNVFRNQWAPISLRSDRDWKALYEAERDFTHERLTSIWVELHALREELARLREQLHPRNTH